MNNPYIKDMVKTREELDRHGKVRLVTSIFSVVDEQYQNMLIRPYTIGSLNTTNYDKVKGVMEENFSNYRRISPTIVARELSRFVTLRNAATKKAYIPNGWSEKRLRFILVFEAYINKNYRQKYLIQGFTDYMGVSVRGDKANFDPNMKLHINSITEATETYVDNSPYPDVNITETYSTLQDLSEANDIGKYISPEDRLTLIRPTDLHHADSASSSFRFDNDTPFYSQNIIDVGSYSRTMANGSYKKNSDGAMWLSRILNSYSSGKELSQLSSEPSLGHTGETLFTEAAVNVPEPTLVSNLFLYKMQSITKQVTPTSFRYGDLYEIDRDFDEITKLNVSDFRCFSQRLNLDHDVDRMQANDMVSSRYETVAAIEFCLSVTAMMSECGVTKCSLVARSMPGKDPLIAIRGGDTVFGRHYLEKALNKLETFLINISMTKLSNDGTRDIELILDVDLFKDTVLHITDHDNRTQDIFQIPTFADSLFSPVISTNTDKNILRADLNVLYDNIMPY